MYKKNVKHRLAEGRTMEILTEKVDLGYIRKTAENFFCDMVKAVVDVKRGLIAIDAELHADLEVLLLENGSEQENLWGINLWIDDSEFIEYDSMINIRPRQNNRSRGVEDEGIQAQIRDIVDRWIER